MVGLGSLIRTMDRIENLILEQAIERNFFYRQGFKEDLGMNTSYCPKCNQIQDFPPGTLANCHHCGYEGCEFLFSYEEDGIQIPYEEDEDV